MDVVKIARGGGISFETDAHMHVVVASGRSRSWERIFVSHHGSQSVHTGHCQRQHQSRHVTGRRRCGNRCFGQDKIRVVHVV